MELKKNPHLFWGLGREEDLQYIYGLCPFVHLISLFSTFFLDYANNLSILLLSSGLRFWTGSEVSHALLLALATGSLPKGHPSPRQAALSKLKCINLTIPTTFVTFGGLLTVATTTKKRARCVLTDDTQQENAVADKVTVMTSKGIRCELAK